MRYIVGIISILFCLACQGQNQWKHEQLVKGTQGAEGSEHTHFINAQGIPCYTTIAAGGYRDAWEYKTNLNFKYLGPNSNGYTFGINDAGQVAWEGGTSASISVNVDGHDFYGPLFPPDPTQDRVAIRGLDDAGNPLWMWLKSGVTRVFRGGQEISGGAAISNVMLYGINGGGDTLYRAATYDDQGDYYNDLYKNGSNITADLLGPTRVVQVGTLGSSGSVLWDALGSTTNGIFDLFLDNQNLTAGKFPTMKAAHPEGINSNNDFIWIRIDKDNTDHMMKGMEDISAGVPGLDIGGIQQNKNFINDRGDVLWNALDRNFGNIAILNGKNLTTDVVGIATDFNVTGIDRFGNGVWYAAGPKVPVRSVFVNQFNLSADAYGGFNYRAARSLAVGVNGQVLWEGADLDGTASVWLSSPVPEPGVVFGLTILAGFGLRRRLG